MLKTAVNTFLKNIIPEVLLPNTRAISTSSWIARKPDNLNELWGTDNPPKNIYWKDKQALGPAYFENYYYYQDRVHKGNNNLLLTLMFLSTSF